MDPQETAASAAINSNVTGTHNKSVIVVGNYNNVTLASNPSLRLSKFHRASKPAASPARELTAFERKTRFIGRETDLASLQDWLGSPKFISVRTIVGPPGIGKTRLALELADLADSHGWTSGFLRANELQRFVNAPGLSEWEWDRPILVIVDYAAQKADALGAFLEHLQDVQSATQEHSQHKFRMLLIEREASPEGGWWAKAFGPSGYSDRRIELADPQRPCVVGALSKEMTLTLIAETVRSSTDTPKLSPEKIFGQFTRTEEARQILGNPLFAQIAALSAAQTGAAESNFSTDALLGGIVERERQLMRAKWRKAKIPDPLFKDLERLVAMVTLVQGVSLKNLREMITSVPSFSSLSSFVSAERIVESLSEVLPFDDVYGYRALEPDLIGDRFIVECDFNAEFILSAFEVDRFSLGPRLWRLLAEYQHDDHLAQRMVAWIRGIIDHLADNTLVLDLFIDDAPSKSSGIMAQVIAEARAKITEGLREGRSNRDSLLLRKDQKATLIARALYDEGTALASSGNHKEALLKFDAAMSDLLQRDVNSDDLLWMQLYAFSADSFKALNQQQSRLFAIDKAIAISQRWIANGKFHSGAFADEALKRLLGAKYQYFSPRGLRFVLHFSQPDLRLALATFVSERADGGVSRALVLETLDHLSDLANSDVYSRLISDANFFEEAAQRFERSGDKAYADELWKAHYHFTEAARSFLAELLGHELALRSLALSSKQKEETEFGIDQAKKGFESLILFVKKGAVLNQRHLTLVAFNFVLGLPSAPPEIAVKAIRMGKAEDSSSKINLAIDLAKQISSVAVDAGVLDRSDFEDALLTAVGRMTE